MKFTILKSVAVLTMLCVFAETAIAQNQQISPLPIMDSSSPSSLPTLPPATNGSSLLTDANTSQTTPVTEATSIAQPMVTPRTHGDILDDPYDDSDWGKSLNDFCTENNVRHGPYV